MSYVTSAIVAGTLTYLVGGFQTGSWVNQEIMINALIMSGLDVGGLYICNTVLPGTQLFGDSRILPTIISGAAYGGIDNYRGGAFIGSTLKGTGICGVANFATQANTSDGGLGQGLKSLFRPLKETSAQAVDVQ